MPVTPQVFVGSPVGLEAQLVARWQPAQSSRRQRWARAAPDASPTPTVSAVAAAAAMTRCGGCGGCGAAVMVTRYGVPLRWTVAKPPRAPGSCLL